MRDKLAAAFDARSQDKVARLSSARHALRSNVCTWLHHCQTVAKLGRLNVFFAKEEGVGTTNMVLWTKDGDFLTVDLAWKSSWLTKDERRRPFARLE